MEGRQDIKDEILAILKANHELGPSYDEHTANQLMELLGRTRSNNSPSTPWQDVQWHDLTDRERRQLLRAYRRASRPWPLNILVPVFVLSIPLLALAEGTAHGMGGLAVLGLDAIVAVGVLWNKPRDEHRRIMIDVGYPSDRDRMD